MTARQQVYSCSVCGQIVAVVHQGGGRLVCCGKPMMLEGEAG
ncbi:desulfoferrodoxin FeS4 iron-binding domain-containing protein, partial [candidate division WOR-3 bacterium]|nr:desulfoferrodoxin FeS4 iron-binding domain-containing protein [candidate division WOR-3 bacterium]